MEALSRGEQPPPQFEVVRTPRSGVGLTHRIAALFSGAAQGGWTAATPIGPDTLSGARAALDPHLEAWAAQLLPDPKQVFFDATVTDADSGDAFAESARSPSPTSDSARSTSSPPRSPGDTPEQSTLERLLGYHAARAAQLPAGTRARVDAALRPVVGRRRLDRARADRGRCDRPRRCSTALARRWPATSGCPARPAAPATSTTCTDAGRRGRRGARRRRSPAGGRSGHPPPDRRAATSAGSVPAADPPDPPADPRRERRRPAGRAARRRRARGPGRVPAGAGRRHLRDPVHARGTGDLGAPRGHAPPELRPPSCPRSTRPRRRNRPGPAPHATACACCSAPRRRSPSRAPHPTRSSSVRRSPTARRRSVATHWPPTRCCSTSPRCAVARRGSPTRCSRAPRPTPTRRPAPTSSSPSFRTIRRRRGSACALNGAGAPSANRLSLLIHAPAGLDATATPPRAGHRRVDRDDPQPAGDDRPDLPLRRAIGRGTAGRSCSRCRRRRRPPGASTRSRRSCSRPPR